MRNGGWGIHFFVVMGLVWLSLPGRSAAEVPEAVPFSEESVEALLQQAQALSMIDRLEAADALYRQVLERDPENLTALNERAKMLSWQGYQQRAINRYEAILEQHPGNVDALEGLAYAQHRSGRNDLARKTAEQLLSSEGGHDRGVKLQAEVLGARPLSLTQFNRYSHDSNDLSIFTGGFRGGVSGDRSAIEGIYEWQHLKQKGLPSLSAHKAGGHLQHRFELFEVNSYLYGTHVDKADFDVFTTNSWVTLRPGDLWRIDVGYDRETFEDINSMLNHIVADSGSVSVDFTPNRFWLFSSKYKAGHISDGNDQYSVFSRVEYRLLRKPFVKLYYNNYYAAWSDQLSSGYFNPKSVHANSIGLYADTQLTKRLFLETQIAGGYEMQRPKSNHPTLYAAAGLAYHLTKDWKLSARAEFFGTQDSDDADGYSKAAAMLSLTYNFGVGSPKLYEASQPVRPILSN